MNVNNFWRAFLRRYVTWCARHRRFAAMQRAARLFAKCWRVMSMPLEQEIRGYILPPRRWTKSLGNYFLICDEALSKAFFIDSHVASIPDCICRHADSLAVRISCNFLYAASRLARIDFSCSA